MGLLFILLYCWISYYFSIYITNEQMANLFLETPTYITEAQLKESTRVTDTELIGTNDDAVNNRKILIRKSEIVIDSII